MAPVPPPQMSLKERIAALQARNATNTSSNVSPQPSSGVLRNKIDAFEKAGFVPVPKGSFGSPTPNPEIQTESRRGELYGNRIPSGKHLEKPLEEQKTGSTVGIAEQRTGGSPAPIREQKTGGSPAPLREQKTGGTSAPLRDDTTGGSPPPVREQKTGGSFGPLREQKTGGSYTPIREQKTGGSFAALDWARAQSQTEEPPVTRGTGRRWSRVLETPPSPPTNSPPPNPLSPQLTGVSAWNPSNPPSRRASLALSPSSPPPTRKDATPPPAESPLFTSRALIQEPEVVQTPPTPVSRGDGKFASSPSAAAPLIKTPYTLPDDVDEFGKIPSPPPVSGKASSYSVRVHGKAEPTLASPRSVSLPRQRISMMQVQPTEPDISELSVADLADLMQGAAMLEQHLMTGELPSEHPTPAPSLAPEPKVPEVKEQGVEPLARVPSIPSQKRHKRVFRIPRIHNSSRSQSADSVRTSSETMSTAPTVLPVPPSPIPEVEVPPTPPAKGGKFYGTLKKSVSNAGKRLSISMSMSSSDDSALVATPPDSGFLAHGDGMRTPDNEGLLAFPTTSPTSGKSIGRAATFAGRMWNRSRERVVSMISVEEQDDRVSTKSRSKSIRLGKSSKKAGKDKLPAPPPSLPNVIIPPDRLDSLDWEIEHGEVDDGERGGVDSRGLANDALTTPTRTRQSLSTVVGSPNTPASFMTEGSTEIWEKFPVPPSAYNDIEREALAGRMSVESARRA